MYLDFLIIPWDETSTHCLLPWSPSLCPYPREVDSILLVRCTNRKRQYRDPSIWSTRRRDPRRFDSLPLATKFELRVVRAFSTTDRLTSRPLDGHSRNQRVISEESRFCPTDELAPKSNCILLISPFSSSPSATSGINLEWKCQFLYIHDSVFLFVSVCLTVCLSASLFVNLSCQWFYLSVCLSVCLTV